MRMTTNATNFIAKTAPDLTKYKALDVTRYRTPARMGPTVAVERELGQMPHIEEDRRQEDDHTIVHECRDMRKVKIAAEHLQRIPDAFECFHLLCSGRYAMWDLAGPAILHHAYPATISTMTIATLGFSKENVAEMSAMLADGRISSLSLLCSHYFKGTNKTIWEAAAGMVERFPGKVKFASVRNHAKVAAIQLADGRTVTIESSANLRSCKNLEFMTVYGHPAIYDFHVSWIDELFHVQGVHRDR